MSTRYDIIVAGGNMTGACLACALADSGLRIAVVEAGAWPDEQDLAERDLRVSALTQASQHILEHLGAWDFIAAHRLSPFTDMHVWDARGAGEIHFACTDIGEPVLGHIAENRVIQAGLIEVLRNAQTVELIGPAAITSCEWDGNGAHVRLANGCELRADLVVGADGARSLVRAQAGIGVHGWSYDQIAVVVNVATEELHRHTAWQRFLPDGPLAFLPLSDGMSAIVWSTSPQHAEALLAMDDAAFREALGEAFAFRLGRITDNGPRAGFPLRLQHAAHYVRPGLALIGDAAHTIHPLAGQGVNLGFLDAAALAEVLLQGHAQGRSAGDIVPLRRYERWRKADNLATMFAMDAFKRVFGSRLPPLRWLRNAGLRLADHGGPLKRHMVRQAMGLTGDLPALARVS